MKFKELKVGDNNIVIDALVIDCKLKQTVNQTPYYALSISDGEDTLDARIWSTSICANLNDSTITNGNVYTLTVKVNDYAGKNQIIITKIEEVGDDVDLSKFFKSAPVEIKDIKEYILHTMEEVENPVLKKIVYDLIMPREDVFFRHQAAITMHHNYIGGLAYHVYSMLNIGKTICELYPGLNKDLLMSGILIHDIGKTKEITEDKSPTYSKEGNLLGHIVIGLNMLNEVITLNGFEGTEEALALLHMVASHHGELEFGSPKEPLIYEALALHFIDLMDAKMAGCLEAVEKASPASYTSQISTLSRKSLYKPDIK